MNADKARTSICRKNSECTEEEATNMIREGIADAYQREKARKEELSQVPLEDREAAIYENFPDVRGDNLITEMTEVDLIALRLKAYYSEKRRMKEMFKKVQEQIAEYHELLEYSNKMESRLNKLKTWARFLEEECKEKSLKVSSLENEVVDLEYSNKMELRLDQLKRRALFLEDEYQEKSIKVSSLENEVVDLKLNLVNVKSSSQRISNELAKVKSENQLLARTLSMQSMGHASTTSAKRGSARAIRHSSLRMKSSNISFDTDEFRNSHIDIPFADQFNLVRPQPKICRRISPIPTNDSFVEKTIEEDKMSSPMSDFVNLTVSWMNGRNWGSKASLASEQDGPHANTRDFNSTNSSCCMEKSDVTARTARLSSSATLASATNGSSSGGYKNADWNEVWPMTASTNPLLRQLREV
eukprot:CAMPEP_0171387414 /NCGR_PEP_ID=MMETSP0879-20121228/39984_1 /TAXON_ID=67004 /ORGANISM="Thalassiosira weissflogii, Strain CCMP1336" /LENGTH=413 /DNA_ID=CAMNT_0011899739 /DNA_START=58 /DNA_END=1299 /DNA_ORIENTATION=+